MNLVCTQCFHLMTPDEAVEDQYCPECGEDSLWETAQLTAEQHDNVLAEEAEGIRADAAFRRSLELDAQLTELLSTL